MKRMRGGSAMLWAVWLTTMGACSGGGCSQRRPDVAQVDAGSAAPAVAAVMTFDEAQAALAARPDEIPVQDAFERTFIEREFGLLGAQLEEPKRARTPPLVIEGCSSAVARDCVEERIGHRFDSSWFRIETQGEQALLIFFHGRDPYEQDTQTGNTLVVFRGRLEERPEAEPRFELVFRSETKVSDAVGKALGRRATVPDPKGKDMLWGARFEPLSPSESALLNSLPDAWVGGRMEKGTLKLFESSPGDHVRFFITREPRLRVGYLSWSERNGTLETIQQVSRKGNTWRFAGRRLRWEPETGGVGFLAWENDEGKGEPYVPEDKSDGYGTLDSDDSSEAQESVFAEELDEDVPEEVRRLRARCGDRGYVTNHGGFYEVRCSCGSPCAYSTFVTASGERTSPTFWMPMAVDAHGQRVAISTRSQMPIRVVGLFDEREWMVIRRPSQSTVNLPTLVQASFEDGRLLLEYPDRTHQTIRETVEVTAQTPDPVYILGSEVNLRERPGTDAEVSGQVTIGTKCSPQEDTPHGWIYLLCVGTEPGSAAGGFTLKRLVSATRPEVGPLLEQARDSTRGLRSRMDAALRAATLEPDHEEARQRVVEGFFELNFEQLAKRGAKAGLHERVVVACTGSEDGGVPGTREDCVRAELEKTTAEWHLTRFRGEDFVTAQYQDGAFLVRTGRLAPPPVFFIESRESSGDASETLLRALSLQAAPP